MAISDTVPPTTFRRGGKICGTFNVISKQVTDPQTGKTRTAYEYDEVELGTDGNASADEVAATRARVMRAKQAKGDYAALTMLAGKSDAEIARYIDKNVTDLASAKAALKLLARAIGMLARSMDIED
jgi:hypothetical protein